MSQQTPNIPTPQAIRGTQDIFGADAEAFAARVSAAGGHCEQRVWPGLAHGYWMFPRRRDGSLDSMTTGGEFLGLALCQPGQPMAKE